jgi:hypothetical protein
MKHVSLAVTLEAMAGLAACGEAPTAVTAEPTAAFAKGGPNGGGSGSPDFTMEGTSCTLDSSTGELSCEYLVSGLGMNGSAPLTLTGVLDAHFECYDAGGNFVRQRSSVRFVIDITAFADESGIATGTGTDGPDFGITRLECAYIYPQNIVSNLNAMAKRGVPILPGEWSHGAASLTTKGPGRLS